ncbi:MAG: pyroglutamyl-peptidase I [Myxococcota bacterium]|nr:pyroglutamyl-peptidase I [Myxococcota bacterium]
MILVTGFVPFVSREGIVLHENPTARIVRDLDRRGGALRGIVLPVSFAETKRLFVHALNRSEPTIWIGLGYAPHRACIDFEVIALNVEAAQRPDNDGDQPCRRPILADETVAYESGLSYEEPIAALNERNVSAKVSFHAGTFLCNQVFYLGCHHLGADKAGFIHVPPLADYQPFSEVLYDWLLKLDRHDSEVRRALSAGLIKR